MFRNKIVEDIHGLGKEILALIALVEVEGGSKILKERVDGIKCVMSRLVTNDIMDIL